LRDVKAQRDSQIFFAPMQRLSRNCRRLVNSEEQRLTLPALQFTGQTPTNQNLAVAWRRLLAAMELPESLVDAVDPN
jgi:hypothetical protein